MRTRDDDQARLFISKLSAEGEKVIESECFVGVNYLVKNNHIVILAGRNGELVIDMSKVLDLTKELTDICSMWADIETKKCIMPSGKNEAKAEKRERKQGRGKKGDS